MGAVFTGFLLAVEFYCVLRRKARLVALFGFAFVLVFILGAVAAIIDSINTGQMPHVVDLGLLLVALIMGVTHLAWYVSLAFAPRAAAADAPPIAG